jgi:hypothetical protein
MTLTHNVEQLFNHICGVMVSMLPSSTVDRGFYPWSGQTKDYKIGICCLIKTLYFVPDVSVEYSLSQRKFYCNVHIYTCTRPTPLVGYL